MKTLFKLILLSTVAIVLYTSAIACNDKLHELKIRYQSEARGKALGFMIDGVIN